MNNWIYTPGKSSNQVKCKLFTFPFAGGSSTSFLSWCKYLLPEVELNLVQLPGRGKRYNEPVYTKLQPLIEELAPCIMNHLDMPYIFFGHSMGSLICFELSRHLQKNYQTFPSGIIVSAFPAPHLYGKKVKLHKLPNQQFIEKIAELEGTPQEVLVNNELLELTLPILRADLELCETYKYQDKIKLNSQIVAFGGKKDPIVSIDRLLSWESHTHNKFNYKIFPGGHFYFNELLPSFMYTLNHEIKTIYQGTCDTKHILPYNQEATSPIEPQAC